jgi:hypothetical protein
MRSSFSTVNTVLGKLRTLPCKSLTDPLKQMTLSSILGFYSQEPDSRVQVWGRSREWVGFCTGLLELGQENYPGQLRKATACQCCFCLCPDPGTIGGGSFVDILDTGLPLNPKRDWLGSRNPMTSALICWDALRPVSKPRSSDLFPCVFSFHHSKWLFASFPCLFTRSSRRGTHWWDCTHQWRGDWSLST